MVETINGPKHFEALSREKDMQIWQRIFTRCGIAVYERITICELPYAEVRCHVVSEAKTSARTEVYICTSRKRIEIWPAPGSINPPGIKTNPAERCDFFYIPRQGAGTVNTWWHAVLSVADQHDLPLAQKLAHAYESETARRRRPAKAIVLKNY